uniref:Uncharacterized protein n=1 Tax=Arundo donax TaxID=35708 RepID=A0A0A9H287_ARUDO
MEGLLRLLEAMPEHGENEAQRDGFHEIQVLLWAHMLSRRRRTRLGARLPLNLRSDSLALGDAVAPSPAAGLRRTPTGRPQHGMHVWSLSALGSESYLWHAV